MTRDDIRFELEHFIEWPTDDRSSITTTSAVLFAEEMARKAAQAERERRILVIATELEEAERRRCIRAIQRMPVPIDQAEGAMRAIAAIEALEITPIASVANEGCKAKENTP